jgi:hypothetical protein
MLPEKQLWADLNGVFPGHAERVENRVIRGMPDVVFTADGVSGWIELKARFDSVLDPLQAAWIIRWWRAGGVVWILWRVAPKRIWLIHPSQAMFVAKKMPFQKEEISDLRSAAIRLLYQSRTRGFLYQQRLEGHAEAGAP